MKRTAILLFSIVLGGGCATLDSMNGQRSFPNVSKNINFEYRGDDLLLLVEGQEGIEMAGGSVTNWWDPKSWMGYVGQSYLNVKCDSADENTGIRNCHVAFVKRCLWSEVNQKCDAYSFEADRTSKAIQPPRPFLERFKETKFQAQVKNDVVELSFNGQFISNIPIVDVLRSSRTNPIYTGPLDQNIKGDIVCNVKSTYAQGSYPKVDCYAYRSINALYGRVSGNGLPLALVGHSEVKWSQQDFDKARAHNARFYQINRWPHLNPKKPNQVPELSNEKSEYGRQLSQEWKKWSK